MLAEYIDGGLEPRERAEVEQHLAECGECYENFAETVRLTAGGAAAQQPSAAVRRPTRWVYFAAAAVLAAVALSLGPSLTRELMGRRTYDNLVQSVGTNRFSEARVAGEFAWGPRPSPVRGGAASESTGTAAAEELAALAARAGTPAALHRAGVASFAVGRIDDAISDLARALELDETRSESAVALSAALIERFRATGSTSDLERSLLLTTAAGRAETPTLLFNRALALELLDRRAESLGAWKKYVALEHDDRWRAEGQAHIEKLTSPK